MPNADFQAKYVEVKGLNKLVRTFREVGGKELTDELKKTNLEAAELVRDTARPLVPVRTGKLAASLKANAEPRTGIVKAGKKAVPYAGPIHFGWAKRHIRPNLFLYNATDQRRREIAELYEDAVAKLAAMFDD